MHCSRRWQGGPDPAIASQSHQRCSLFCRADSPQTPHLQRIRRDDQRATRLAPSLCNGGLLDSLTTCWLSSGIASALSWSAKKSNSVYRPGFSSMYSRTGRRRAKEQRMKRPLAEATVKVLEGGRPNDGAVSFDTLHSTPLWLADACDARPHRRSKILDLNARGMLDPHPFGLRREFQVSAEIRKLLQSATALSGGSAPSRARERCSTSQPPLDRSQGGRRDRIDMLRMACALRRIEITDDVGDRDSCDCGAVLPHQIVISAAVTKRYEPAAWVGMRTQVMSRLMRHEFRGGSSVRPQ